MPSKPVNRRLLPVGAAVAAALLAACSPSSNTSQQAQQSQAASTVPDDAQAAATAAFGPDGVALAWGDFPDAGGRQVLAVTRLTAPPPPASGASETPQTPETTVDVIHVSILVREANTWKEALHADEHLKNRRGYLDPMRIPASGWRMHFEKTPDIGFRLEFTPLGLPAGTKPETTRVAWNPKREEYDSLDSFGTRFLEPASAPGGAQKVER